MTEDVGDDVFAPPRANLEAREGLVGFPVGTIIGIMGLIAYATGGKLFGPERLAHGDVIAVYKQRKDME